MDWLTTIAAMPGPQFLVVYGVAIVWTLLVAWVCVRFMDATSGLPTPPMSDDIDAYHIAYLRGGEGEVGRLAVFDLVQRGYLEITGASKRRSVSQSAAPPATHKLSEMERELFEHFESPRSGEECSRPLERRLRSHCAPIRMALEERRFLRSSIFEAPGVPVGILGFLIIAGLGGYKLSAALAKGRTNVLFLILMGVVSTVVLVVICRPQRLTHLGARYLAQLRTAFKGLESGIGLAPVEDSSTASMLLLGTGIFGVAALAGTQFSSFSTLFGPIAREGGGSGWFGGDGMLFGSDTTGCDGGGGGCGGGGCGGCGGD